MKAIIFDMDGLMIDSERLYFQTEREIAANFGSEIKEQTLWKMMGRSPLESIKIMRDDLGLNITPEELLFIRDSAMEEKLKTGLEPLPGLFEILNQFKSKMKLAIATGARETFLNITMEKLKLKEYFDVLQTSDKIKNGKPHPEIYLTAVNKLKLVPEECVVLEDSSNGSRSAKDAGCYVIAVPSEYTIGQDFSFVNFIAKNLFEARDHILNMN